MGAAFVSPKLNGLDNKIYIASIFSCYTESLRW